MRHTTIQRLQELNKEQPCIFSFHHIERYNDLPVVVTVVYGDQAVRCTPLPRRGELDEFIRVTAWGFISSGAAASFKYNSEIEKRQGVE